MKVDIQRIIKALIALEEKGCHLVFFEYGSDKFKVRIFKEDVTVENIVFQRLIFTEEENSELDELYTFIENMKFNVYTTLFQCYKRKLKGGKAGKWEKTKPCFALGDNATTSMFKDGCYINDPDNKLKYFVDMTKLSETDK